MSDEKKKPTEDESAETSPSDAEVESHSDTAAERAQEDRPYRKTDEVHH